jgi:flagellar basal-body rod modification protein FlgD
MNISDVTRTDSTTSPAATQSAFGATPSKEEFLKLFVAQLEHQDPLDPRDGAEMVAEMAQFASLEQTAAINARLDTIAAQGESSSRAQMLSLVGKTIEADASSVQLTGTAGAIPPIDLTLDRAAAKGTAIIRDASGAEVRRIDLGARPAGKAALGWDGTGPGGTQLPAGAYTIEIEAVDAAGADVTAKTRITGVVDAVQFADDGTYLRVGNIVLNPSDIASVGV